MKRIVGLSLFIGAFGPTPLLPILPNRYYSIRWLRGLRPRAPAYFFRGEKVGKTPLRGTPVPLRTPSCWFCFSPRLPGLFCQCLPPRRQTFASDGETDPLASTSCEGVFASRLLCVNVGALGQLVLLFIPKAKPERNGVSRIKFFLILFLSRKSM